MGNTNINVNTSAVKNEDEIKLEMFKRCRELAQANYIKYGTYTICPVGQLYALAVIEHFKTEGVRTYLVEYGRSVKVDYSGYSESTDQK